MPVASTSFVSVEAAWFCTMRALSAPCPPTGPEGTVVKCLDTLYRQRRIDLLHARILRIWGRRGVAPDPRSRRERSDWCVWREALDRLDAPLRARGIVAGPRICLEEVDRTRDDAV